MDNNYMNDNSDITENKKKKGYFSYLGKTILFAIGLFFVFWLLGLILALAGAENAREAILRLSMIIPMLGIIFSPGIAAIFYYTQK